MISKKIWDEAFEGFTIYDCAVRQKNIFYFSLIKRQEDGDETEPAKRLVSVFTDGAGNMAYSEYTKFSRPRLAVAHKPKSQAIMISAKGHVAVLGGNFNGLEDRIPLGKPDTPLNTSAHALVAIDGYVYAVGPWRAVCRRLEPGKWENLADRKTLPEPKPNSYGSSDDGFDVIDGYSGNDIYAGGEKGDLWHFDGKRWDRCPVPTDMLIESICCAGDDFVYVGLQSGAVMRGRGQQWQVIHIGSMTLPFQDMVWFAGKVWCTSDYGVWTIENGKLVEPDLPPEVRSCSGNLSVGDGVMLLAGMYGATVFDGSKWTALVPASM